MARPFQDCMDATEPLEIRCFECHILGGKKKNRRECMLALAGKDDKRIEDIVIDRNIIKVKLKGSKTWTRYQSSPTTRNLVAAYDRSMVQALHKLGGLTIPEDGLAIVFYPPRGAISLKKLRSAEFRNTRNKSRRDRKGQPKRPHRAPDTLTLQDVRNGAGFSQ